MKIQSLRRDDDIEEIIKEYSNMVYRLAISLTKSKTDSDDIFQEVFLRYIKRNTEFDSEEHRKAWLIRVTINCSNSFWTSAWKKKTIHLSDTDQLEDHISFELQEETVLYNEITKLPKKYRTVIHLFYYEDMSIEQISKVLHIKPATVRTQLTRARAMLKVTLKGE